LIGFTLGFRDVEDYHRNRVLGRIQRLLSAKGRRPDIRRRRKARQSSLNARPVNAQHRPPHSRKSVTPGIGNHPTTASRTRCLRSAPCHQLLINFRPELERRLAVSFAAIGVSPSSTWLCLLGGSHRLSRVPNKACRSRGGVRANSRAVPGCVSLGA
jgi:hypothetical protein